MNLREYGRYTLIKKLATGGMAEVFLAKQRGLEGFEKLLVIKRILPHLADDEEFVQMFLNEARIAARFNHPAIVQIYDLGKQDDTYFIAMEFIHGEDMGRVMRKCWSRGHWIPHALSLLTIARVGEALYYAHNKTDEQGVPLRVIHRDISPQNILVSFDGTVKLVDFGIARAAGHASSTRSGAIKGKFAYMAPEQASNKAIDHRTDIFATGLVLYEMLTGVRPLKRETDIGTLQAAMECRIEAPSAISPDVPAALDPIVMKALAPVPDDRYADCRAFQLAIEQHLMREQIAASSVHLSEFMRTVFADRLAGEAKLGRPDPHSADSASGSAPPLSFPAGPPLVSSQSVIPVYDDAPPPVDEGQVVEDEADLPPTKISGEWEAPPATAVPGPRRTPRPDPRAARERLARRAQTVTEPGEDEVHESPTTENSVPGSANPSREAVARLRGSPSREVPRAGPGADGVRTGGAASPEATRAERSPSGETRRPTGESVTSPHPVHGDGDEDEATEALGSVAEPATAPTPAAEPPRRRAGAAAPPAKAETALLREKTPKPRRSASGLARPVATPAPYRRAFTPRPAPAAGDDREDSAPGAGEEVSAVSEASASAVSEMSTAAHRGPGVPVKAIAGVVGLVVLALAVVAGGRPLMAWLRAPGAGGSGSARGIVGAPAYLTVETVPPGLSVFANDRALGKSPVLKAAIPSAEAVTVRVGQENLGIRQTFEVSGAPGQEIKRPMSFPLGRVVTYTDRPARVFIEEHHVATCDGLSRKCTQFEYYVGTYTVELRDESSGDLLLGCAPNVAIRQDRRQEIEVRMKPARPGQSTCAR